MEIEPSTEFVDRSSWSDYKSDAPSSISMIEPPAGVRLIAPVSIGLSDPFAEFAAQPRLSMGESESDNAIAVSTVSTTRRITSKSTTSNDLSTPQASSVWSRGWPRPLQLESEVSLLRDLADLVPTQAAESGPGQTGPGQTGTAQTGTAIQLWLDRISETMSALQDTELSDPASGPLLNTVGELADAGFELARQQRLESDLARDLARLSYSLERRYAVWTSVHRCVRTDGKTYVAPRSYSIDSVRMSAQLELVRKIIAATEDASGWSKYLLIDQLDDLAHGRVAFRDQQVALARDFLDRVTNHRVTPDQLVMLKSEAVHRLADQVHPLTIRPVDYRKLLIDIETIENNPVHRYSGDLADAIQSLRYSEHPELGDVSDALSAHYRNANVRLSVSKDFINRMMPRDQISSRPVQARILGAETRGASRVETDLMIDLIPDPAAWHLVLNLDGDINSRTQSSRNGATFYNSSSAHVQSNREIRVDSQSLRINGNPATVESSDALRQFSTNWDSMPIVGDMIRYVAHQEFTQSRPVAKRITQKMIAKQTDEELDRQLRTRIDSAQQQFDRRLLGPLQSLNLSPLVLDMQTTESRLIARYRMAAANQISAYTPRPLAPGDSLLSVQVHQSVFNNLIEQAIDSSRDWTVQGLADQIADVLQQPRPVLPSDTPNDITIRFANHHPMSIEFEQGRMWLTLRIDSLEQPGRIHLKNFSIRTSYAAIVDGLQAELIRDGIVSIDGNRLGSRDRLPLRAIFTKVFSGRSALPMVSRDLLDDPRAAGLAVSQFEIRDGWFAIAISDAESPNVATFKANATAVR